MNNMEDKERLLKIQKDLEDGIIIEEDLSNVVPIEEQGVFHAPFFFEQ